MPSYVLTTRSADAATNSFGRTEGDPTYVVVPDAGTEPQPSHAVADANAWMRAIVAHAAPAAVRPGEELDIVFFVHGYNTDAVEALKRQRLVESELRRRGFDCIVIGFDWPTAGNVAAYLYDRNEAQEAATALVGAGIVPFTKFNLPNCPIQVHVMAHSMGGFVVREAFRWVDKGRDADLSNDWRVGQLVLFAADVASESFVLGHPDMAPVFEHCGRLTNYFSGYDEALAVSNVKNIDISSRVGRVGMPANSPGPDKALDVDCGPRYKAVPGRSFSIISGMVSHSWYLEDPIWYDDLAYTLMGQIDRNLIRTRSKVGENDFVLNT